MDAPGHVLQHEAAAPLRALISGARHLAEQAQTLARRHGLPLPLPGASPRCDPGDSQPAGPGRGDRAQGVPEWAREPAPPPGPRASIPHLRRRRVPHPGPRVVRVAGPGPGSGAGAPVPSSPGGPGLLGGGGGGAGGVGGEDRVLIAEVVVKDKDGGDLEDSELARIAVGALKGSKANAVLTRRDVQEDVHRIIDTGYFASCMPSAEDTRDGVRLIYKIEPNQEMKGLLCTGASVLPTRVVQDAFRDEFGKVVNIQRLNNVLDTINGWYSQRGLFGQVADVELANGVVSVRVAESQVNSIAIKFRDKKTGEPTTGKTKPETILRQLMTKKGQVYCLPQGRRDVETVFTMGIMEDVNLVPQPAPDGSGNVDLTFNMVERVPGGFSAGGGLSGSSISGGALSGLIGSFAYSHRNMLGKNQKLNVSVERGQFDSMFKLSYTDPWIEGDDKRTSRAINIQNSRSPGMTVHGVPLRREGQAGGGSAPWQAGVITIGRLTAGLDYSRPIRPRWNASAGLSFQRAGARDDQGHPRLVDAYGGPLTFSGRAVDDMLVGKLELVYTDSAADSSSSQLVMSSEQALPIAPDWLFFNRVNLRARKGFCVGLARCIGSFSGGTVVGDLAPHEAFPIGGTNSVRGYDEGAVGSGRSYIVCSGEVSFPMFGPLEGAVFADLGTDLGSGETVLGNPAGARGKPGQGACIGAGVRVDSPLGPLRLEYALNDHKARRFHFGIGYRN